MKQISKNNLRNSLLVSAAIFCGVGNSISQTSITLSGDQPLVFTNVGTGTYNKTVIYNSIAEGLTIDLAKETNDPSARPLDFKITTRGGGIPSIFMNGATGHVGLGSFLPEAKLTIVEGNQKINFGTGNNTSAYKLDVGVNDDGVSFTNNSTIRSFNFRNAAQSIEMCAGGSSSNYTLSIGANDNGVNFTNNSTARGFNFSNANGTLIEVSAQGQVGIGTCANSGHKLAVEGSIAAREIKVQANSWCDYVFEKDYTLTSIANVEAYIESNGHLKDIPSEREVLEEGFNLGEMDAKLLRKIEELTLYTIAQEKELEEIRAVLAEIVSQKK